MAMIESLYALRDVDIPAGARTRVRARIEAQLARRPRRLIGIVAFTAAAAAAVVVLVGLVGLPGSVARREFVVPAGTRADFVLAHGHSSVHGPAQVTVDDNGLSLTSGRIDAQGRLRVRGPACDVFVDGAAEVSVKDAQLMVRVFAGSVQIVPPAVSCEMIDLTPAKSPASPKLTRREDTSAGPQAAELTAPAAPTLEPSTTPTISTTTATTMTPTISTTTATRPSATPPTTTSTIADRSSRPGRARSISPAGGDDDMQARTSATAPTTAPSLADRSSQSGRALPALPASGVDARSSKTAALDPPSPTAGKLDPWALAPIAGPPAQQRRSGELADALTEYRAATALESTDPTAAVLAWQAWRTRRSNTALAHGADLRLLALLGALHRHDEAAALAREFLARYPHSPRRADVARLIEKPR
jgi:hypothetical protein